jgi:hypothetical protein
MALPAPARPATATNAPSWSADRTCRSAIVHAECAALSGSHAHRALLPTSPAMTVAGLVPHLRWIERCWSEDPLREQLDRARRCC